MKTFRFLCPMLLLLALAASPVLGGESGQASVAELMQRGRAEMDSKCWEVAVSDFRLASETEPTNSAAYNLLGYSLARLDRHQESIVAFERALSLDPLTTNAWAYLGNSYYALGDYTNAADVYRGFVSLEPNSERGCYRLACCLYLLKAVRRSGKCLPAGAGAQSQQFYLSC